MNRTSGWLGGKANSLGSPTDQKVRVSKNFNDSKDGFDTDWRQEKETRKCCSSSMTHQSDALWVPPKLTNVFLKERSRQELI